MDKLENLKKKIEEIQARSAVASDLKAFVEVILGVIKKSKQELHTISDENIATIKNTLKYLDSEHEKLLKNVRSETSEATKDFENKLAEANKLIAEIKAIEVKDGVDGAPGKDADEEVIVEKVLAKIPPVEVKELDAGELADKLETLKGDKRLDASAIKNLPELVESKANGGGWRNLFQLHDVSLNEIADGDTLVYNSDTEVWENGEAGGGGHIIEDEGTPLTQRDTLNFVGAGVAVTDVGGKTTVTIGGGGTTTWGDIVGTLADQLDLQAELDGKADSLTADQNYVSDAQLVVIGNTSGTNTGDQDLSPYFHKTNDDTDDITIGATNKFATAAEKTKLGHITVTQAVDLDAIESASHAAVTVADSSEIDFTLTGQQISAAIVASSIDEAKLDASVNASLDLADSALQSSAIGVTVQGYDADLATIAGLTATTDNFIQSKGSAWASRTIAQVKTDLGLTGTNSGDQTSIVGITGTKAQFDTAVTDGNFLYVGDITQYTDELAQDAVGAMVDTTLVYTDGTPLLSRAALTGAITASGGSNATALGSFTLAALNTAISDGNVPTNLTEFVGQTAWRVFYSDGSGDVTELALGADGTFLKSNGAAVAPSFAVPAGSGDVSKVGTPVDNQIAIWTGDGTIEGVTALTYDGTSLNLATAKNFQIAGATVLADAAGTTTLSNIDALDGTTESTIEAAIDTLANLTSIQGRTVTLADAGANAIFGWDDTAGAYENLTQAEARTVLGLGTAAYVATDLADLNEATIEGAIDTLANLTSVQGRTVTLSDAGFDVLAGWDDSASAYKNFLLADITAEGAPASGDFFLMYGAEGDLRKVDFDDMPGGSTITGTDTHVLFFDGADNPAGDAGMTYNKTTDTLTVVKVNGLTFSGNDTDFNTFVGKDAGLNVVSGATNNTFIGDSAGKGGVVTNASDYNVAVGKDAMLSLTTGNRNTAVGVQALGLNATGTYNTAFGLNALYQNLGNTNTAFGTESLATNSTGSGNVALGYFAGYYETASNSFYVDNQDRTDLAGGKAGSLLYGTFNATPASQTLRINASVSTLGDITVPDEAYGAGWNGSLEVPTKNAVYDQVELKAPLTSPTFATSVTGSYLTASEILITDGSKNIVSAPVATYPSLTELTYVKGVTSAIQTQFTSKANTSGALTQFVGNNNWKVWYSDGSGDVQELALGADGTFLKSNGAAVAPSFATPAGSGDVTKVGTPVNNQIAIWTGDGTIEGDSNFTYSGSAGSLYIGTESFELTTGLSTMYFDDTGFFFEATGGNTYNFQGASSQQGILDFSAVATTSKTFTFPNTTGTIALTSNLSAYTPTTTTVTIAGTANQITSSAGAQDLSANRTWTLSLPADVIIPTVLTVPNTGLHILDTNASHDLIIKPGSNVTADRTLTLTTGDTDMIVDFTAVTDEYVLAYDTGTNTWRGIPSAGSGITRTVVVTSGSATMGSSASTDYAYFVAGAHTMSLPAAAANTNRYTVKNNHSAAITIDTVGAENIEGASSILLDSEDSVDIISDGTNWWVV